MGTSLGEGLAASTLENFGLGGRREEGRGRVCVCWTLGWVDLLAGAWIPPTGHLIHTATRLNACFGSRSRGLQPWGRAWPLSLCEGTAGLAPEGGKKEGRIRMPDVLNRLSKGLGAGKWPRFLAWSWWPGGGGWAGVGFAPDLCVRCLPEEAG